MSLFDTLFAIYERNEMRLLESLKGKELKLGCQQVVIIIGNHLLHFLCIPELIDSLVK